MTGDPEEGRYVDVGDTRLWVLELGRGYPLIMLHGGPGLDHSELRPWMDPLADRFRLVYVDQRSQGRSDPADERTWTVGHFVADVTALASSMGLDRYAVLGHSFGSFVALRHAAEQGTASHYVLIGCAPAMRWLDGMERILAAVEPAALRERITAAWDLEATVRTVDEHRRLLVDQLPFHFADPEGEAYRRFVEQAVDGMRLSPDVLRAFVNDETDPIEVEDRLPEIAVPVLVIAAEFDRVTVPEAGWAIAEAVPRGECVLLKDAGHMMFAEKPEAVHRAITGFFDRFPMG